MPRFSIIVVHYQGTVAHELFRRAIDSIHKQTFTDYEILAYHDGPLLQPELAMPAPIRATPARFNDWGHSLRDIGIREAGGEYIMHLNADGVLYPEALATIDAELRRPPRLRDPRTREIVDTDDIVIFPIKMFGLTRIWNRVIIQKQHGDCSFYEIMTGNPPIMQNIDAMQLVMKRSLWLAEGGWRDRSEQSDGVLYEAFCRKYPYRTCGPVLGEHH